RACAAATSAGVSKELIGPGIIVRASGNHKAGIVAFLLLTQDFLPRARCTRLGRIAWAGNMLHSLQGFRRRACKLFSAGGTDMKQLFAILFAVLLVAPWSEAGRRPAEATPWLQAGGTRLVDPAGRTVVLRGINLGGWLVEEIWMMPFAADPPAG